MDPSIEARSTHREQRNHGIGESNEKHQTGADRRRSVAGRVCHEYGWQTPDFPHTQSRHVIYLHGRIVQVEQSSRPQHPEYGYYELEKILDTFRGKGLIASGEIRPKSATVSDSADRVVEQVRQLLESGVPADHVTVVGGSMGAAIALVASARLQNPEVRFGVLGTCLSNSVQRLVANEGQGSGRARPRDPRSDRRSDWFVSTLEGRPRVIVFARRS